MTRTYPFLSPALLDTEHPDITAFSPVPMATLFAYYGPDRCGSTINGLTLKI